MFKKVDCVLFRVPDLEKALDFYRDRLHHKLVWRRGNTAAGLRMDESETEIVLAEEKGRSMEVDLLVESTDEAIRDFEKAGGHVVEGPFDIAIGRCAVVKDPWDNVLVILDTSKGLLKVDEEGNVLSS
jgi:lactoylglutathione lyase